MQLAKKILIPIIIVFAIISTVTVSAVYITNNRDTKEAPEIMTFTPLELNDEYENLFDGTDLSISYRKTTDVFVVTDKSNDYSFKTGIDSLTEKYTYRALDTYLALDAEEKAETEAPVLSTMSDTFINRANSVLSITYFDENLTTQYLESAGRDVTKEYAVEESNSNIFSVTYTFSEIDLSVMVIFTLSDTGIKVSIPDVGITGEDNDRLDDIAVFPFLGAAGGSEYSYDPDQEDYDYSTVTKEESVPGYSVIPDGSGALVRFVENTQEFKRIELPVYGIDSSNLFLADQSVSQYNVEETASMPMYGMVHGLDQNGFLAYSSAGDPYMTIVSVPYGLKDVFYNYTYAKFNFNQKYFQLYNESGDGTTVIRDERYHYDIEMNYEFLNGDDANYIGIADAYKDVIEDSITSTRDTSNSDIPIRLDFLMSDATSSFIGYNDTVVTTASNVRSILDTITESGITNINSGLLGYQSGGETLQNIGKVDYNSSIGSKKDYSSLISDFAKDDIDISFINDNLYINEVQTSLTGKASRHVGGTYDELTDSTLGNKDVLIYNYMRSSKLYDYTVKQVESIIDTVSPESTTIKGISSRLISDYGDEKNDTQDDYSETFSKISSEISINATRPNSYLWPYIDRYLNADAFNSQYLCETDSIPLISYILRDYMEVYADYSNFSFYDTASQLRMIDYNMYPSFILTNESSHYLINSNSNEYFSTEYTLYSERIDEIYTTVNTVLKEVNDESWTDRTVLSPGVILNSYTNNKSVIINYTDDAFTYNGVTVNSMSSKVV